MFGVHLVGVAEGVVGGVDDDVGVVADVGAAVGGDEVAAAVGVGRPTRALGGAGEGDNADPGRVAEDRRFFAQEDGVGEAVLDIGDADAGVAVEGAVNDVGSRSARDGLGLVEVVGVGGGASPRLVDAGVGDVVAA